MSTVAALVREAAVGALRGVLISGNVSKAGFGDATKGQRIAVTLVDFKQASSKLGPSVMSAVQRKRYETLQVKLAGGRGGEIRVREEGRAAEVAIPEDSAATDVKSGDEEAPMKG